MELLDRQMESDITACAPSQRRCWGDRGRSSSNLTLVGCLPLTGGTPEPVGTSTLQPQLCRPRKEKGEVAGKRGPCQLTPRTQGSESWFLIKADGAGGQCRETSSVPVLRRFSCKASSPETKLELGQLLSSPESGQRELLSPLKSSDGRPVQSRPGQPFPLAALPWVPGGLAAPGCRAQAPRAGPGVSPTADSTSALACFGASGPAAQ